MAAPLTYRTPGVYVEWLDSNAQRLELARTDVAGFVGLAERGPVQGPVKLESLQQFWTRFGDPVPGSHLALAVYGFFSNGGRTCWVVRAADQERALPARLMVVLPGRAPFVLRASSPGAWGNRVTVAPVWGRDRVEALAVTAPGRALQRISLDGLAPAPRRNLLGVPDDLLPELAPEVLVDVVEPGNATAGAAATNLSAGPQRLAGGDDGIGALSVDHLVGDSEGQHTWGIDALERVSEVAIVAVPDLMVGQPAAPGQDRPRPFADSEITEAQARIVGSCARCRDRIALLDLPPVDRRGALAYRRQLPSSPPNAEGASAPASYAAAYHPWLLVSDPAGGVRPIPPSGHVAGVYARVDRMRGVHKPPANEQVEAAWDLTDAVDDAAHADLNDAGLNAIRAVPGRGVLVLGARTLADHLRWRYVNVRRLLAVVEDTLETQMQSVTFEPNVPGLWRELDRTLRGFLQRLYRAGMLDGATADDAFFVRCDETTNPPAEIDAGRVTCLVGLQPPFPAEFVVVRIGVTRSGIDVEEKGAQDA